MTARLGPRILVPVLGGDIGPATFARTRSALQAPGACLVILHVAPPQDAIGLSSRARPHSGATPRWRRLARTASVFVDAVSGDPASVIRSQAERFHSDLVLIGRPAAITPRNAWVTEAIAGLQRTLAGRVEVLVEPASRPRAEGRRVARYRRTRTRTVEASC